jgi:hypothetical protein
MDEMNLQDGDMTETDDEIEAWIVTFESQCRENKLQLDDLTRQINNKRIEKESLNDKYQRVRNRQGELLLSCCPTFYIYLSRSFFLRIA